MQALFLKKMSIFHPLENFFGKPNRRTSYAYYRWLGERASSAEQKSRPYDFFASLSQHNCSSPQLVKRIAAISLIAVLRREEIANCARRSTRCA